LKSEFPELFADPQALPPLRWQNHRIELEEGATLPKSRGLPRLSPTEMAETRKLIEDLLRILLCLCIQLLREASLATEYYVLSLLNRC